MEKPLAGVKVLDLSRLLPGPFCSLLLADMGAEVVKVEQPGQGDMVRWLPPLQEGMSAAFLALNRGKKSITLNLRVEVGRQALMRLIPHFDVFLESNRPGVMARLGLGYAALSDLHPGLVYCSISGYGQTGPMCQKAGHDINYLALAGVLGATGPTQGPPGLSSVQIADIAGGSYPAALSIVAALFERMRTGKGRFLDISMTEGALALMTLHLGSHLADGSGTPPEKMMLNGGLPNYNTYRTKDGQAIALGALEPKFWLGFCEHVGRPDLLEFGHTEGLAAQEGHAALEVFFASRTRADWTALFSEVDVCLEPVLDADETVHFPLHLARGMIRPVQGAGDEPPRAVMTSLPFGREAFLAGDGRMDEILPGAPALGEHGPTVLAEHGFSEAEIVTLQEEAGL